jgi:long-chain acyl-CoA synthetase
VNLAAVVDGHPADRPALISRGKVTTYGELRDQVARIRGGLVERNVRPGDRVALLAANNWYFVSSFLAVLGIGAVAVPLNPSSPPPEVQRELEAVGARLAIVGPTGRSAIAGVDIDGVPTLAGVTTADGLLASEPAPAVERDADDLAVLLFTSGTAGAPRAARLTHGNLLSNIDQVLSLAPQVEGGEGADGADGADEGDPEVVLAVLPLFHVFGLNGVLGLALRAGWTVVLVERFDAHAALEAVVEHGVSVLSGVPTMWSALANLPGVDPAALSGVRLALSGAAALDPLVAELVRQRLGITVAQGYGLTEASPAVTTTLVGDAPPGSIGKPIPGVELRLVGSDGADVLVGDPGELWVRGPNVFAGYWDDDEATAGALSPDGWLRTGDVGVVDDDGFLFLVDRVKDVVIVSGFNVYPAEVEEVLSQHPAVAEAAVIGTPHPHTGETVKAFVVPTEGASIEEEALVSFVTQRLARYKAPTTISFVDRLPHNIAGKLMRRSLR